MPRGNPALVLGPAALIVASIGCNLPSALRGGGPAETQAAGTIYVLQTRVSATQTAIAGQSPTPTPTATFAPLVMPTSFLTAAATFTPRPSLVTRTALCYTGPGPLYLVVSGVRSGTPVEIIAVGSVKGWYVIINPTYHDRCWIESASVQVDPSAKLSSLPVFKPPPVPRPSETPEPTQTP
jgi:hypothetical protein